MNMLITYIQFIFIGFVIYGSVLTFGNSSFNSSISGIVAPILVWFAGTGLRASFNGYKNSQKQASIFMAVIILALSYLWINASGYWYILNGIEISGKNLLVISFFIGFLSTTKTISQIKKY